MPGFFDETYYLTHKAAQLAKNSISDVDGKPYTVDSLKEALASLGSTPEAHYKEYGRTEKLNPNSYFNETEYLAAKKAALAETDASWATKSVDELSAYMESAGMSPAEHYEKFGAFEANSKGVLINPSNAFDANAYFAAKLVELKAAGVAGADTMKVSDVIAAFKAAGLSPVTHYEAHGAKEAIANNIPLVQTVPSEQRVANDPARTENVPGNYNPPTVGAANDAAVAAPVAKPADMGAKVPAAISPTVVPPAKPLLVPGDADYKAPPANMVDTNAKPVVPPSDATGGNWAQVNPDGSADLIKPDGTPGDTLPPGSLNPADPSNPVPTPDPKPETPGGGGGGGGGTPEPEPFKIVLEGGSGNFELDGSGNWTVDSGATIAEGSAVSGSSGNINFSSLGKRVIDIDAKGISGAASITTSGVVTNHTVKMGNGANTVTLGQGAAAYSGGTSGDTITLSDNVEYASIKLIDASGSGNSLTLGGSGGQKVTLATGTNFTGNITGSESGNELTINTGAKVEGNITLGDGNDTVNLNGGTVTGKFDLGTGDNELNTAASGSYNIHASSLKLGSTVGVLELASGSNIDGGISGGSTAHSLTIAKDADVSGGINLGAGNNKLTVNGTLASGAISFGDNDDNLTIGSGGSVSGDITLGDGENTVTINGAVSGDIAGGADKDTVTVNANVTGSINLYGGDDSVVIGAGGATASGGINLGSGDDTLSLNGVLTGNVTLGSGSDSVAFFSGGSIASGSKIADFALGSGDGKDDLHFGNYNASAQTWTGMERGESGGSGAAFSGDITAFKHSDTGKVALDNNVVLVEFAASSGGTQAEVAGLFGASKAFTLADTNQAIVVTGASGSDTFYIWHVTASGGTVSGNDVTLLGTASGGAITGFHADNFDLKYGEPSSI